MDSEAREQYYRFQIVRWAGPRYYARPDGQDLLGKISYCVEGAFLISAPIGLFNAYTVYPFPTSHAGRFMRVFRAVVPGVGMGLAFAVTTYYSTVFRKKDDFINHSLGGLAAGTIFGAANGFARGLPVALMLALIAGFVKQNQHILLPEPKKRTTISPYLQRNLDFSGVPDFEGNWVKAERPKKSVPVEVERCK